MKVITGAVIMNDHTRLFWTFNDTISFQVAEIFGGYIDRVNTPKHPINIFQYGTYLECAEDGTVLDTKMKAFISETLCPNGYTRLSSLSAKVYEKLVATCGLPREAIDTALQNVCEDWPCTFS